MDSTMPDRGLPLSLWGIWWNAILLLRPAFSRLRTFMWFATAVAGLTVRLELLGVTSIVRALNLRPRLYTKLLDHFHSSGINLDRLSALWTQAVLQMFPHLVRVAADDRWHDQGGSSPTSQEKPRNLVLQNKNKAIDRLSSAVMDTVYRERRCFRLV